VEVGDVLLLMLDRPRVGVQCALLAGAEHLADLLPGGPGLAGRPDRLPLPVLQDLDQFDVGGQGVKAGGGFQLC
jgi:hypothetical protein